MCVVGLGTLIFIVLLLVIGIVYLRGEAQRGRSAFDKAAAFEREKDYAGACYYYAISDTAGNERLLCQQKIKTLWNEHGPFDFSEQLENVKDQGWRLTSMGEGYHQGMVAHIQKLVEEHRK
jgi:hypothetical protein